MPKYVIERALPGLGAMSPEQLRDLARQSNEVLNALGPDIQWVQSYITDDLMFCVYIAADEAIVREHALCGGFPVTNVYQVRTIIDPTTAETEIATTV